MFIIVYWPSQCSCHAIGPEKLTFCFQPRMSVQLLNLTPWRCRALFLGDFNLPKTKWSTMCSTCQFEDAFLNILNDNLLHALSTDSTYSAGQTHKKIQSANFYSVSLHSIDSSCWNSDHLSILRQGNNCDWDFLLLSFSSSTGFFELYNPDRSLPKPEFPQTAL